VKPVTLLYVSKRKAFVSFVNGHSEYNNIALSQAQLIADALIERRVGLVFIDGAFPQWRTLVLGAKSSAATRRIPLCFVSDDSGARAEALSCGADLTVGWAEFHKQFSRIVKALARTPDPATMALLECQCREALPALAVEGLREFNRGEYYSQHDLLEAQWVKTAGPVRDLYRAILQVGVAYYQIERGNYRGALKMLQRSVQWLHLLPEKCQDIDVGRLRRDSYALRAELQRLGPEGLAQLDRRLLKPIRWRSTQADKT